MNSSVYFDHLVENGSGQFGTNIWKENQSILFISLISLFSCQHSTQSCHNDTLILNTMHASAYFIMACSFDWSITSLYNNVYTYSLPCGWVMLVHATNHCQTNHHYHPRQHPVRQYWWQCLNWIMKFQAASSLLVWRRKITQNATTTE